MTTFTCDCVMMETHLAVTPLPSASTPHYTLALNDLPRGNGSQANLQHGHVLRVGFIVVALWKSFQSVWPTYATPLISQLA